MKRISTLFFALLATMIAFAQSVAPDFSTVDNPQWFSVQFKGGSAYLSGPNNSNMVTVTSASSDAQKFQFIGTESSFKMKSKAGQWVTTSGTGDNLRFKMTATESQATELRLVAGTAEGYFEIGRVAEPTKAMNQWQGTGVGKAIGEWGVTDNNNQLFFHTLSVKWPTFTASADAATKQYYFINFARGGRYMAESTNGTDDCVRLYSIDANDAQQWMLVGTADNFQLLNKAGHYAYVSSESINTTEGGVNPKPIRFRTTPDENGFKLVESTNTTNGVGFEIQSNGISGSENRFNLWGSPVEGNVIGFWKANDQNNVVQFTEPSKIKFADYKSTGIEGYVPEHDLTLWYTKPATTAPLYSGGLGYSNWMEYALPIGDGQFGASLFGGIAEDQIQFNEKTLWSGTKSDNGSEYGDYENFGSVYAENLDEDFDYSSAGGVTNYLRQLDLTTATGRTRFTGPNGVNYTREYISSNPARVVAAHYTADKAGKISLRFTMKSGKPGIVATTSYADGEGTFSGSLETVSYNARFKVVNKGGEIKTTADGIEVRGADEVLLILAGGTDFDAYADNFTSNTAMLGQTIQARVNDAAAKDWAELYSDHVADFKTYFDRVDFQLQGTKNDIPTNELVDTYNKGNGTNALMLERLYFAYGRYLEISSSRGVDLPSNLQGIWNNMSEPAWNADIHSNINVQMNYWPAETTNLSEMHVPFLHYIWNMAENHDEWKAYAKTAGQNRGWTCYTENNIFGGVGSFMHNYVIANAWYATHLWQHYRYTLDKTYLKKVFPAMLSASQFWMDRLKLASDGTYETPNEYSPEHGPTQNGVAHAQQLVAELFDNTLDAIEVLGQDANVSADDLATLKDRYSKLDKGLATEQYNGEWGSTWNNLSSGNTILREWKYSNFTVTGDKNHRHMSHLMCMYPFSQVYPGTELFDAAVNSMKLRGDGATGWSMGWKINLWARALDGDHARTILSNALAHSAGGAGVFYNLFDSHAPFQIDGNFGACAGIAEMIMQSNSDTIRILPALPTAWKEGKMMGLKAVKDFTVNTEWKDGKATYVAIRNNQGQTIPVLYKDLAKAIVYKNGTKVTDFAVKENGVATLSGNAGDTYVFDFVGNYDPTGIEEAGSAQLELSVEGRQVSFTGKDVKDVKVYDLQGRQIQTSAKAKFSVAHAAGQVVMLQVTDLQGQTKSYKVALEK